MTKYESQLYSRNQLSMLNHETESLFMGRSILSFHNCNFISIIPEYDDDIARVIPLICFLL